jgi:hypothetical protein
MHRRPRSDLHHRQFSAPEAAARSGRGKHRLDGESIRTPAPPSRARTAQFPIISIAALIGELATLIDLRAVGAR